MSNEDRVWNDKGKIPMHIYKTKNMENKGGGEKLCLQQHSYV